MNVNAGEDCEWVDAPDNSNENYDSSGLPYATEIPLDSWETWYAEKQACRERREQVRQHRALRSNGDPEKEEGEGEEEAGDDGDNEEESSSGNDDNDDEDDKEGEGQGGVRAS